MLSIRSRARPYPTAFSPQILIRGSTVIMEYLQRLFNCKNTRALGMLPSVSPTPCPHPMTSTVVSARVRQTTLPGRHTLEMTRLSTPRVSADMSCMDLHSLPLEICSHLYIVKLSLFSNALDVLPVEIGALTNLRSLTLSSNILTHIPTQMQNLTRYRSFPTTPHRYVCVRLVELYISHNEITEIPFELVQFTAMVTLHLDYNRLATLPFSIG